MREPLKVRKSNAIERQWAVARGFGATASHARGSITLVKQSGTRFYWNADQSVKRRRLNWVAKSTSEKQLGMKCIVYDWWGIELVADFFWACCNQHARLEFQSIVHIFHRRKMAQTVDGLCVNCRCQFSITWASWSRRLYEVGLGKQLLSKENPIKWIT
jgi:hypothetical protein